MPSLNPVNADGEACQEATIAQKTRMVSDVGALTPLESAPLEEPLYCEIDIQSAEKLSTGSLLFPLWKSNEESGWCVMVKSNRKSADLCDEYEIVGRIKRDIGGPEFMSLAYEYILNRKLSDNILQSDWSIVESRRITRRGVLKMFLESGDAGLRNRQFLLVPDPSPWLDQIEGVLFQTETASELSI
jgi:hypothetical protein